MTTQQNSKGYDDIGWLTLGLLMIIVLTLMSQRFIPPFLTYLNSTECHVQVIDKAHVNREITVNITRITTDKCDVDDMITRAMNEEVPDAESR